MSSYLLLTLSFNVSTVGLIYDGPMGPSYAADDAVTVQQYLYQRVPSLNAQLIRRRSSRCLHLTGRIPFTLTRSH